MLNAWVAWRWLVNPTHGIFTVTPLLDKIDKNCILLVTLIPFWKLHMCIGTPYVGKSSREGFFMRQTVSLWVRWSICKGRFYRPRFDTNDGYVVRFSPNNWGPFNHQKQDQNGQLVAASLLIWKNQIQDAFILLVAMAYKSDKNDVIYPKKEVGQDSLTELDRLCFFSLGTQEESRWSLCAFSRRLREGG